MDVAIKGDGFVEVETADNGTAYYRGGTLTVDKDGMLATGDGHAIKPSIHVGNDGASMIVQADGQVLVQAPGQAEPAQVGHLDLVRFADTTGLVPLGANLYQSSARSGEPITGRAGEDGLGTLAQGYTEASNVNLVEEMINLMVAQRAYESNVKIIQAADDMLSMSNNLRR